MTEFDTKSLQAAIQSETPLLIDFWAPWCMPCKILAPVLEELSDELDGKLDFGKVDIDQNQELAKEYAIETIPTMIIFKKGEPVGRLGGAMRKEELLAKLQPFI